MEKTFAIRDPVHNYIEVNKAELALIDSTYLQRLRWISQLSGVRLVFPGAQHSRLAHVMGVMHLAGEYVKQVYQELDKSELNHRVGIARLAGLLHDIGHGPFSHAYDDTVYRDLYPNKPHGHDIHRFKIIESDFIKPYIEDCGVTPNELADLWQGKDRVMQAITQGALGADRMDFMLRDAYYAGTSHFGSIASKRLISNALISDHDNEPALHYNLKVLEDIFQSLLGRFYMYRGVYFHKASAAADILIRKLLDAAKDPLNLAERTKNLEEYQWINEYTVIGEIMASSDPELDKAKEYTKRLLSRDLPKLVWESTLSESNVTAISGDLESDARTIAKGQFIKHIEEEATRRKQEIPMLYITNTYPMSTIDSKEFEVGNIFIWDAKNTLPPKKKSYTLQEAMNNTAYFRSFLSQVSSNRERYVMIRVFSDATESEWIRKFAETRIIDTSAPSIDETSY
ncbi:MAG: HD domain-containing protein [Candidatus Heimdallarchaeota archaeon]|nr:HD domain-containing protein [Candidatus Heimdallarchaeota archaeon]